MLGGMQKAMPPPVFAGVIEAIVRPSLAGRRILFCNLYGGMVAKQFHLSQNVARVCRYDAAYGAVTLPRLNCCLSRDRRNLGLIR